MAIKLESIQGSEGVPPEPDWTQVFDDEFDIEEAHESWGVIIRDLREAGTLALANGHAIKRLVEFRIQYERAARNVAERGAILVGKGKRVGQWNPFWALMQRTSDSILKIEDGLGLTPLKRSRAGLTAKKIKNMKPADVYLAQKSSK